MKNLMISLAICLFSANLMAQEAEAPKAEDAPALMVGKANAATAWVGYGLFSGDYVSGLPDSNPLFNTEVTTGGIPAFGVEYFNEVIPIFAIGASAAYIRQSKIDQQEYTFGGVTVLQPYSMTSTILPFQAHARVLIPIGSLQIYGQGGAGYAIGTLAIDDSNDQFTAAQEESAKKAGEFKGVMVSLGAGINYDLGDKGVINFGLDWNTVMAKTNEDTPKDKSISYIMPRIGYSYKF